MYSFSTCLNGFFSVTAAVFSSSPDGGQVYWDESNAKVFFFSFAASKKQRLPVVQIYDLP